MSQQHAHGGGDSKFVAVNVAILAVSDTRTIQEDKSGDLIAYNLETAGHHVTVRSVCKDDKSEIQEFIKMWAEREDIDFIITTGGTGVTGRDITPDAVSELYTKHIPGFGELFRHLSFAEIGSSTIQSRADAGVVGSTIVFVLPGSTGACRLALDQIIIPQLNINHTPCNFTELLPRIKHDPPPEHS